MLDEIVANPVKPYQRLKLFSAGQTHAETIPPFKSTISFLPFIKYLKGQLPATVGLKNDFYKFLIAKFEAEPSLFEPIENIKVLEDHEELLELLSNSLFPAVGKDDTASFALAVPYQFDVFYHSDSFKKLFLNERTGEFLLPEDITPDQLKVIQTSMIYDLALEKFYGIKLNDHPGLIYSVADAETGMKRFYRLRFDRRFIDIHARGELPPIQDCAVCLNTFRILDLDKQLAKMPTSLFEAEGFAVWVAEDVTTSESLDTIKKILLRQDECDTGIINDLKSAIHVLAGLNNLQIGLMPFIKINDSYVLTRECTKHSLVSSQWQTSTPENIEAFRNYLGFLDYRPEPMPISIVNEEMVQMAPFLRPLYEAGVRSYITYPMQNSDGPLGILELASTVPNQLTQDVMARLEPAIPLLSVAMLKNRDAFHQKIEKLIKEKFTALQDSVQWKFAEAAWSYLQDEQDACETDKTKVGFDNVYPLYGAIDIRNSSSERNSAIQKDLKEHLLLVDGVLDQLQNQLQLPLLEGLKFRNDNIRQSIETHMLAEDEIRINEFLENELGPVLTHLQKGNNKQAKEIIDDYLRVVDTHSSKLHRHRQDYEDTVGAINNAVLKYLEGEEEATQKSYPHYFEKYRTDGVEYNVYIGQSIAPHHPFDMLYLKNIRLWQIRSMAEVARITHKLLNTLKVPLETTQLILIHNQPISICFRKDERKFDVEGSYNIRYEIMKKRLDKVCIKDTGERLTQPGKIAMVYSNQKDVQEYQLYIEFLQNKNILKPGIEHLELEELQGIKGLKAMRVAINLET